MHFLNGGSSICVYWPQPSVEMAGRGRGNCMPLCQCGKILADVRAAVSKRVGLSAWTFLGGIGRRGRPIGFTVRPVIRRRGRMIAGVPVKPTHDGPRVRVGVCACVRVRACVQSSVRRRPLNDRL